jgi:beta-lactam-binding protein with PASTA domain
MTILAPPFMPPVTVPAEAAAPACLVPKLKGRRLAAARRALRAAGCQLGTVSRSTAEAAPGTAGLTTVLAQRPRAGTGLAAGSKVAVTLSR